MKCPICNKTIRRSRVFYGIVGKGHVTKQTCKPCYVKATEVPCEKEADVKAK